MLKKIFNLLGYSFHKLHKGIGEEEIIDFQIKQVKPDLIIDCGANCGDFYKLVKKHKKRMILFEPNPDLFKKLNGLSKIDKNLTFINKGTDKKNCSKNIFITNDTGQTLSSIKKPSNEIKKNFKKSDTIKIKKIQLVSLNYILSKLKISNKQKIFLKLDTQGNDFETLIGLKKKIKQVVLIKTEMPVTHLYHNVKSHWEMLKFLKKNKFKPIHFTNGPRDKNGRIIEYDVIFLKES